ncbi:hypothetical protein FO519_004883 [Halicephalobus sp. NKZ332]|nr:hypothetical protein FO519_004883 [Halicephalobus sp. NKZ332]
MLDPRSLIPFLYDPSTLALLQQQGNPGAFLASQAPKTSTSTSSPSTAASFRIHDLLESSSTKNDGNPLLGNPVAASAMLAQMMAGNFSNGAFPNGSSIMNRTTNLDRANSSGENDSLLDDLDANQSSSSPRSSSAGTPPLHDRSQNTDRASNCSSTSAGGPIHGKKARKARTIFTDKQLQELETTFERQKYLSVQDRVDLAHRMGLTDTQVKTWYQNRRTKWKRQAAVGVDLLQEASNMAAVQNLIRTNPYWSQFTRSLMGQDPFMRGMVPPGNPLTSFPGMMFPPGMLPPSFPGFGAFPGMTPVPQNPESKNESKSPKTSESPEIHKNSESPESKEEKMKTN